MLKRMQRIFVHIYFIALATTCAARRATHCINRYPSLDSELFVFVPDDQITSSSYMEDHTPSDARMSGDGWCAESICKVESDDHYIQVDFGAELVIEAIAIVGVEGNGYVTEYYVEYGLDVEELYCVISQESNETIFVGVDICRRNSNAKVKNFTYPVITRFIRVIPLEWEGVSPCLRLELYGCHVKECSQITEISSNTSLLPPENIHYSSFYFSVSYMDISDEWCANRRSSDPSPNVTLNFTEQVYLIYAVVRGSGFSFYVTNFSFVYENQSDERVTYMNVSGVSFFGLSNTDDINVLLWTPINTSYIQLNVHEYVTSYSCIGINFYGCTYNEVVNHASDEVSVMETTTEAADPTSCADIDRPEHQQPSVITVTTTLPAITLMQTVTTTVPANTLIRTVSVTPQSSCSCSDQQQASASSSSDSDVVTICVPVVVVIGVIILIVVVVIGILIWRKAISRSHALPYDKVVPNTTTVENDLYGLESTLSESLANNNETSHNGVQGDRKDSVRYEYPTTVVQPDQLPAVTYETVSLHEEDASETASETNTDIANPVYSEVRDHTSNSRGDPQLEHNPSYKTTDQS